VGQHCRSCTKLSSYPPSSKSLGTGAAVRSQKARTAKASALVGWRRRTASVCRRARSTEPSCKWRSTHGPARPGTRSQEAVGQAAGQTGEGKCNCASRRAQRCNSAFPTPKTRPRRLSLSYQGPRVPGPPSRAQTVAPQSPLNPPTPSEPKPLLTPSSARAAASTATSALVSRKRSPSTNWARAKSFNKPNNGKFASNSKQQQATASRRTARIQALAFKRWRSSDGVQAMAFKRWRSSDGVQAMAFKRWSGARMAGYNT